VSDRKSYSFSAAADGRLAVTITGALQTPTGRMVFGRLDGPDPADSSASRSRGKSTPKRVAKGDQDTANPR